MRRNPQNSQQKSENCAGICKKTEKCAGIRKICTNNRKIAQEFPTIRKNTVIHKICKRSAKLRRKLQKMRTIAQEFAKFAKKIRKISGIRKICINNRKIAQGFLKKSENTQ